jgi:hypothetical protein
MVQAGKLTSKPRLLGLNHSFHEDIYLLVNGKSRILIQDQYFVGIFPETKA